MYCTATTKSGRPCRSHAVRGSDPPRCSVHGGLDLSSQHGDLVPSSESAGAGLPVAGKASEPQPVVELPDLSHQIFSLDSMISGLSSFIQRRQEADDFSTGEYVLLLRLHGQLISRLGRLMRDQRALTGEISDGFAAAVNQALDELSVEMGIDI